MVLGLCAEHRDAPCTPRGTAVAHGGFPQDRAASLPKIPIYDACLLPLASCLLPFPS
ncbi:MULTISPECIES: hypothetical protein [unclassified Moorena]|uniref:hypothetical protein n=1 Tax=unclassified Moorena TaxID=2683338 RepID=UPI0012B52F93|nr:MULTISPECIES: hypothetical protein [unclassified Moorena]NEP31729.1 hypothetical protein [Moorena sp. SIO3B2]NEQ05197.1 hypothetical protein [Moorena sp. SIO4E2]